MRTWLAIQFVGAVLSVLAGIAVALAAKSAIHEIEAILLVGLGALTMAIIGIGAVAEDQSKQELVLLREIREALKPR